MPWITQIVFKQAPNESLLRLPNFDDGPKRVKFRHIVHFYRDAAVPENTEAQRMTFATLLEARRTATPRCAVAPISVTFKEDDDLVPDTFVRAPPLGRVVTDLATFKHPRHLPLIFDIIDHGLAASGPEGDGEEFCILTNSDIHFQPNFYLAVADLLALGYDVVTINRRTVDAPAGSPHWNLLLAEHGSDHPGFDCFVFPTRMLATFVKSRAAVGAGYVMRGLLLNLIAHARRFLMVGNAHLTFHIGDAAYHADPRFSDYVDFNVAETQMVADTLAEDPDKARRLADFISVHEGGAYRAPTTN